MAETMPLHYRYSDVSDSYGNSEIILTVHYPVRETPCGYWVSPYKTWPGERMSLKSTRWVSKTSTRRFCYPDKTEAWNSYQIRNLRRIQHLERQLSHSRRCLAKIQNLGNGDSIEPWY